MMAAKIATLIVDDEPLAQRSIEAMIENDPNFTIVGKADSLQEAKRFCHDQQIDLVFLDVRLPDGNGFELLHSFAEPAPVTVFVTAYDQFAIRAFEVEGVDYLLKPFSKSRFRMTLDRVKTHFERVKPKAHLTMEPKSLRIQVRHHGRRFFVDPKSIHYIEAADYYAVIHVPGKKMMVRKSLTKLAEDLEPLMFRRVHRSYLINLEQMDYVDRDDRGAYQAVLKCGTKIPLGPKYQKNLFDFG